MAFLTLILYLWACVVQQVNSGDATNILIDRLEHSDVDLMRSLDIATALKASYENQKTRHRKTTAATVLGVPLVRAWGPAQVSSSPSDRSVCSANISVLSPIQG